MITNSPLAGTVVWITGLSGAGKSTVSRLLCERLKAGHAGVIFLDGDVLREIFGSLFGHHREDRLRLASAYGRLCRELAGQGAIVVCATISMFHDVRRWNRANIPGYVEIYLRVPVCELVRRDAKGLYGNGATADLVGIDQSMEEPEAPDLVIDNHGGLAAPDACVRILACLEGRGKHAG